jgi:nucleotide-binding universal stress UspA family protein
MKKKCIKKVLIAIDYNQSAQKVAEKGYEIAHAMGAEITLLHVLVDPIYYASPEYSPIVGFNGHLECYPILLDSMEGLTSIVQIFLNKMKVHLGDEKINTLIKNGDYSESILESAKDIKADMIVMGSHSQKWLEKIVMGSVSENVIRYSAIPTLIIPTSQKSR